MHTPVMILGTIGFYSCLMIGLIMYFRTRHRERLALIKYGKDATIFEKTKRNNNRSILKWAMILMGGGLGILVGAIIDSIFHTEPGGVFASLMIFGGAAMFVYYSYNMRYPERYDEDPSEMV